MGTYGFAQFQIDVRQADDDLKRAIDEFKRLSRAGKHEKTASDVIDAKKGMCENSEE